MTTDPTLSLAALDGTWPDPGPDATRLVRDAHLARTVPLQELDAEQLRLLLTQGIGVEHVAPLTLRRLATDPLLEGDLYPGDVLAAVLRLDQQYWRDHPDDRDELLRIAHHLGASGDVDEELGADVASFLQRWS